MTKTHRTARLPEDRLHLQEGPIDLVIGAFGGPREIARAYAAAEDRFDGLLAELSSERRVLRQPLFHQPPVLHGATARRMARACWSFRADYITPMAAMAGAVADTILEAMLAASPKLARAYVNHGGDLALHLTPGNPLDIGVVPAFAPAYPDGFLRMQAEHPARGIATGGWRSHGPSRGIADAVTVLARSGAEADAAASIIADAVDVADAAIGRRPARELDPDSEPGAPPVTVEVGALAPRAVDAALAGGVRKVQALLAEGLIEGALLALAGEWRSVGAIPAAKPKDIAP